MFAFLPPAPVAPMACKVDVGRREQWVFWTTCRSTLHDREAGVLDEASHKYDPKILGWGMGFSNAKPQNELEPLDGFFNMLLH